MKNNKAFDNLKFDQKEGFILDRRIIITISLITYVLLWQLVSTQVLFWIHLLGISILVWVSNFGWKQALDSFINYLKQLSSKY